MPKRTLVLVAFAVLVGFVEARFEWRNVVQQVAILPDGTILVNDERTLWTNEDFGDAFICIEHSPNERVVLLPGSGAIDRSHLKLLVKEHHRKCHIFQLIVPKISP